MKKGPQRHVEIVCRFFPAGAGGQSTVYVFCDKGDREKEKENSGGIDVPGPGRFKDGKGVPCIEYGAGDRLFQQSEGSYDEDAGADVHDGQEKFYAGDAARGPCCKDKLGGGGIDGDKVRMVHKADECHGVFIICGDICGGRGVGIYPRESVVSVCKVPVDIVGELGGLKDKEEPQKECNKDNGRCRTGHTLFRAVRDQQYKQHRDESGAGEHDVDIKC